MSPQPQSQLLAEPKGLPQRGRATFAGGIYDRRASPRARERRFEVYQRGYPVKAARSMLAAEVRHLYCDKYDACLVDAATALWDGFRCPAGCQGRS